MTPKRPGSGDWERMPDLRIGSVVNIERWYHTDTGTSVCSGVEPIDGNLTYHVSILGRKPAALVLLDFDMVGAEEVNVCRAEARHFWKPVESAKAAS